LSETTVFLHSATNLGGFSFTAADGYKYAATCCVTAHGTYSNANPIANTVDDVLYQSNIWENTAGSTIVYTSAPVTIGNTYRVTVKLAEIYFTTAGSRVFRISDNGLFSRQIDLVAEYGPNYAVDFVFDHVATAGVINITCTSIVENCKMGAILIEQVIDNGVLPPAPCSPGQSVCGDNNAQGSEVCDGTDLAGQTCVSQGFDSGSLGCLGDCSGYDTSGCGRLG